MVSFVLSAPALVGAVYYLFAMFALLRHFRSGPAPVRTRDRCPSISLLKPVSGLDAEAEGNIRLYMSQDYTDYEILLGVLDPNDPALPVMQSIARGRADVSVFTGSKIDGANNKVRILHTLARHARGQVVVTTDADTRAGPGFLDAITRPFEDPAVGVVTCMYRGIHSLTTADALEGLYMTCVFLPGVAAAHALGGIDFGLGAAIAVRRETLEDIGGFESIVDYLADDFQLGRKAARAGWRVALSRYVVEITLEGESLGDALARELRWQVTTRVSKPWGHFGLALTFGFAYSVLYLFASGFAASGWEMLVAVGVIRMITASIGAEICLGDHEFRRRAYLLPVRDLLSFAVWLASLFTRRVRWRGRVLRVRGDGRMEEG